MRQSLVWKIWNRGRGILFPLRTHLCAPFLKKKFTNNVKGIVQRVGSGRNSGSLHKSSLKREARKVFRKNPPAPPSSESPLKFQNASLFSNLQLYNNLDGCGEYSLRTWIQKLRRFVNTITQFKNMRSIHSGFYK